MPKKNFLNMPEPTTITSKSIRSCFGEIINKVYYSHQPYIITRQNKPLVVMLGLEEYEDLLDMLDTMAEQLDSKFQKSLLKSRKEIEQGKGGSLADIKKILDQKLAHAK